MSCYAIRDAIIRLNPSYHHQRIVHLITTYEFPWLTKHALDIATLNLMSTLDVPTPAGKSPFYLSDLILQVMTYGYSSSQGMEALKKIDGLFSLWGLNRVQIIQVFAAYTTELLCWYEKLGWRELSEVGYEALLQFWCVAGQRLKFTPISITYNNMEDAAQHYLEIRRTISIDHVLYIRRYPIWQRPVAYLMLNYLRRGTTGKGFVAFLARGRSLWIRRTSKSQLKLPLHLPEINLRRGPAGD